MNHRYLDIKDSLYARKRSIVMFSSVNHPNTTAANASALKKGSQSILLATDNNNSWFDQIRDAYGKGTIYKAVFWYGMRLVGISAAKKPIKTPKVGEQIGIRCGSLLMRGSVSDVIIPNTDIMGMCNHYFCSPNHQPEELGLGNSNSLTINDAATKISGALSIHPTDGCLAYEIEIKDIVDWNNWVYQHSAYFPNGMARSNSLGVYLPCKIF